MLDPLLLYELMRSFLARLLKHHCLFEIPSYYWDRGYSFENYGMFIANCVFILYKWLPYNILRIIYYFLFIFIFF